MRTRQQAYTKAEQEAIQVEITHWKITPTEAKTQGIAETHTSVFCKKGKQISTCLL
jgi:hypothetical protein